MRLRIFLLILLFPALGWAAKQPLDQQCGQVYDPVADKGCNGWINFDHPHEVTGGPNARGFNVSVGNSGAAFLPTHNPNFDIDDNPASGTLMLQVRQDQAVANPAGFWILRALQNSSGSRVYENGQTWTYRFNIYLSSRAQPEDTVGGNVGNPQGQRDPAAAQSQTNSVGTKLFATWPEGKSCTSRSMVFNKGYQVPNQIAAYSTCGSNHITRCGFDAGDVPSGNGTWCAGEKDAGTPYYYNWGPEHYYNNDQASDPYACEYHSNGERRCFIFENDVWHTVTIQYYKPDTGYGVRDSRWRFWACKSADGDCQGDLVLIWDDFEVNAPGGEGEWADQRAMWYWTGHQGNPGQPDFYVYFDDIIWTEGEGMRNPDGTAMPEMLLDPGQTTPPPMTCPRDFVSTDDAATIKQDLEDISCRTYTFEDGHDFSGLGEIIVNRANTGGPAITLRKTGAGSSATLPSFNWTGDWVDIKDLNFARTGDKCLEVAGDNWVLEDLTFTCTDESIDIDGNDGSIQRNVFQGTTTGATRHAVRLAGQSHVLIDNDFLNVRGVDVTVDGASHSIHHNTHDRRGIQTNCSGVSTPGGDCMDGGPGVVFQTANNSAVYSSVFLGFRPTDSTTGQTAGMGAAVQLAGPLSYVAIDNNIFGACDLPVTVPYFPCDGAVTTALEAVNDANGRSNLAFNLNFLTLIEATPSQVGMVMGNTTLSEIINNTVRGDEGATISWLDGGTGDNVYRAHLLVAAGGHTAPTPASVGPTVDGTVYIQPVTEFTGMGESQKDGPFTLAAAGGTLNPCYLTALAQSGSTTFYIPNVRPTTSTSWLANRDQGAGIDPKYGLGADVSHPPGGPEDLCTASLP